MYGGRVCCVLCRATRALTHIMILLNPSCIPYAQDNIHNRPKTTEYYYQIRVRDTYRVSRSTSFYLINAYYIIYMYTLLFCTAAIFDIFIPTPTKYRIVHRHCTI